MKKSKTSPRIKYADIWAQNRKQLSVVGKGKIHLPVFLLTLILVFGVYHREAVCAYTLFHFGESTEALVTASTKRHSIHAPEKPFIRYTFIVNGKSYFDSEISVAHEGDSIPIKYLKAYSKINMTNDVMKSYVILVGSK